ncbi:hypothetical protein ACH4U6_06155 [Streptomyces netropsis]|uniref:hypothetical protein n=1 Tax=Streptomyces netropsis TaxID=55404 RepID=UPI0037A8475B
MRKEQGGRSRTAGLAVLATALGGVLLMCALAALSAAAASRPGPCVGVCVTSPPTAGEESFSPSATPAADPTAGAKPPPPLPRPMPPPSLHPHAGPVAGNGHELAHSGPPMSASMAFGGAMVMLGAGLALVVLYRSRHER